MSQIYIPKALRERVAAQAGHRCGYCLTAEAIVGTPLEIDHIIPQSLGGLTEEDNTPTGRATVAALNLNRLSLVKARQAWVAAGWHPPKD